MLYFDSNRILTCFPYMDPVIIKVLMKTNTFGLISHKGVSSLLAFGLKKMKEMFDCLIDKCHEIKTIVYSNETSNVAFNALKTGPDQSIISVLP